MKRFLPSFVLRRPSFVLALAFAAGAAHAGVKYWDNPDFRAFDVGDYVQDGLVVNYDGIRNAGPDKPHDSAATNWVNCANPAVTECRPRIPWCCNMAGPASGRAHGDWFVPWVPALAYYDPANLARRIPATCRVVVPEAGLGDYVCPPSGVMAFYNALACPKEIKFVQGATHLSRFPANPAQTSRRSSQPAPPSP